MEKKVLAVDFDSQANLSTCFGVEDTVAVPVTIGHLMLAQIDDKELPAPDEYIMSRNGVDFIPSSMVLSAVDAKLRLEMEAEKMLSRILIFLHINLDNSSALSLENLSSIKLIRIPSTVSFVNLFPMDFTHTFKESFIKFSLMYCST